MKSYNAALIFDPKVSFAGKNFCVAPFEFMRLFRVKGNALRPLKFCLG
ncbi:MAG: hypothetical protein IJ668_03580 [Selenomonadaceae bacterium]|nr:hypothetical protein [Selenomonadaceae bacterium]